MKKHRLLLFSLPVFLLYLVTVPPREHEILVQLTYSLLVPASCLLATWKYAPRECKSLLERTRPDGYSNVEFLSLIAIVVLFWLSSIVIYSVLFAALETASSEPQRLTSPVQSGVSTIAYFVFLSICAGFFEEFYFRGVLGESIAGSGGSFRKLLYVVISAALFGLEHRTGGLAQLGASVYVGIGSALFYLRLRSIWPLVVAHIVTDFLLVALSTSE